MKKMFFIIFIIGILFPCFCGTSYVHGYRRKNGTYVSGHYRNITSNPSTRTPNSSARTFSKEMRLKKYRQQNGVCPHCRKKFAFEEMEGDHIIPYSKGGQTVYNNLQMLCRRCNRVKGNRYSH